MPDSTSTFPEPHLTDAEVRSVLQRQPTNTKLMHRFAQRLVSSGALDEAIEWLEIAAALRPDTPELAEDLALALITKGDLIAADLWLSRIVDPVHRRQQPELRQRMRDESETLTRLAAELEAQGRIDDALDALRRALGHTPDDLDKRLALAELLLSAERHEAVEAYLEAAPDDERVVELRRAARERLALSPQGRPIEAARALHSSTVKDLMAGRAVLAEPVFRELTLSNPDYHHGWLGLRAARRALGKHAETAAVAEDWAKASPSTEPIRKIALARPASARGLMFDLQGRFPLVTKEAVLTRVETAAELKQTPDSYLVLDPGGTSVETHPFFQAQDEPPPSVKVTTSESYVLALDNAIVAGRGALITQKGQIISEQFFVAKAAKYQAWAHKDHVIFDKSFGSEPVASDYVDREVFLCMGPTDRAYGDWLNQFPPRLMLAQAAELDCPVLLAKNVLPQYIDMLEAVGLPRKRMLFQKNERALAFRRVYAPSWPYGVKNRPIKGWLEIYKRAARPPASGERKLIYLSRRFMTFRRLVNVDEIEALFAAHGFEVVIPEQLSFSQTLDLFSNPACVAGPWGSAFQSLAFCHTPPVAMALISPYNDKYMRSVGAYMHAAGVKFGYAFGEIVEHRHGPNADPWIISLDKAKRALERTLEMVERQAGGQAAAAG